MTHSTVRQEAGHRYGFNIYKDGELLREHVVVAGSAAIAEAKVSRYLNDGEYPWYVVPRLIDDEAEAIDVPVIAPERIIEDESEPAA